MDGTTLYIKNMVCNRCIMVVEEILKHEGFTPETIELGRAVILEKLTKEQHLKKKSAIDAYIKPLAPCGNPYSGVLPEALHKANSWNRELYFKVR